MSFGRILTWEGCFLSITFLSAFSPQGWSFSPSFSGPIPNITVARGRDAKFTCRVRHLGGYRVGWVKADTKAIQAIHTHVITHNQRVQVVFDDHSTWHLILKGVIVDDQGPYMCQINTDPMISQIGYLEVVTPPEIDDLYSTSDVVVTEGSSARLRCKAKGHPIPEVTWHREDSKGIRISDGIVTKSVTMYKGEELLLPKVTRDHMGAFLCIANNNVPPTVSKRISLDVHFHPIIHVPNQLIGSPYGQNVSMQCNVEAFPPPVTFWNNEIDEMLSNSSKYHVSSDQEGYVIKMHLTVIDLASSDIGEYKCVARNSIGKVESSIKVNFIQPPTPVATLRPPPPSPDLEGNMIPKEGSSPSLQITTDRDAGWAHGSPDQLNQYHGPNGPSSPFENQSPSDKNQNNAWLPNSVTAMDELNQGRLSSYPSFSLLFKVLIISSLCLW